MTHPTRLTTIVLLASIALLVAACGGEDEEPTPSPAPATGTEAPAAETEAPAAVTEAPTPADGATDADDGTDSDEAADAGAPGVAVLTIGEETWTFDGIYCAEGPEAAGNDRISFTLSVLDSIDDTRVQLDATIQDPEEQGRLEGDGVIYSVTLTDVEDFEDPSIAWSAPSPFAQLDVPLISVDGKQVAAEGPFDDERTEEFEEVPGTLSATCP